MLKKSELIARRAAIAEELAKPEVTDERVEALNTEYRGLARQIERAEIVEDSERREAGTTIHGDENLSTELHKRFSLVRAMAMQAGIGGHDFGFEREVQPELLKRAGRVSDGGILVPVEIFLERRTLTTTAPSGAVGGNLIATELHGEMMFDRLRSAMKVQQLGATVLSNLVGNVDIPGLKDSVTGGWVAEDTALTASTPGFRKVSMTPKHVGGLTEISRNMLMQTSVDIENLIRNDFAQVLAGLIDKAAVAGSGSGAEPRGILNTSGIGSLPMGTNGSAWTADASRDLIGKVDIPDAPSTSRGFLSTNKVKVSTSKIKDGQGNYLNGPGVWADERIEFSSNVPSDLTKGTGTGLSAVIYGNWADLLIGYWSAFDFLVNPYESSAYTKGNVSVRAMATCDVAVRYVESFAASKDVLA